MTTPYGVSVSLGSSSAYSDYLNTPIMGPLSTNQYPSAMPYHSFGTLKGIRPTPPQFLPSQEPLNSDMNSNARYQYLRAHPLRPIQKAREDAVGKASPPIKKICYSTKRQYPVSSHMNYIEPIPSSMKTSITKSTVIGKYAYKTGRPIEESVSTKCYFPTATRSTLRRVRSGGCVSPAKKGSLYNHSLTNPNICVWGGIPRQNY
jgi:hypothetical protein